VEASGFAAELVDVVLPGLVAATEDVWVAFELEAGEPAVALLVFRAGRDAVRAAA
jgi:hypothetical protein